MRKQLTDMNLLAPHIEESLSENRPVRITVTGYSMYPLLRNRKDSVIIGKAGRLKKYDIVFYKRPNGSYILHRILKIDKENLLSIAGDNEIETEYPVKREQIIGTVTHFIKNEKKYSVKNPIYILYVIVWAWLFPFRHKLMPKLIMLRQKFRK